MDCFSILPAARGCQNKQQNSATPARKPSIAAGAECAPAGTSTAGRQPAAHYFGIWLAGTLAAGAAAAGATTGAAAGATGAIVVGMAAAPLTGAGTGSLSITPPLTGPALCWVDR